LHVSLWEKVTLKMFHASLWEKANSGRGKLHVSLWEKETTLVEKLK